MDNTGYVPEEPIAAVATALAPAALGIIRLSGKNSVQLLSKIFSRPKALNDAAGNTIVYGWILEPRTLVKTGETDGGVENAESDEYAESESSENKAQPQKIDEVLVSVFRSPRSFTGEEMAEISCHGGTAVVTRIFDLLLKSGFRAAERGEFTFRAFINGKTDLTKAEAVREIIDSRTKDAGVKAAGRLAGSLADEILRIKKLIVDTLAQIEVEIEYPEDEETIADAYNKKNLEEARDALAALESSWKSEKLYQEGARIVLAGRTNAGKSSLFNALLKEERAIVSDVEGTTRDWIESWISIDGIPARLFDTAGLRQTSDKVELAGLESTRQLSDEADLILYLIDSTAFIPNAGQKERDIVDAIDRDFISARKEPVLFVWNKIDKVDSTGLQRIAARLSERISLEEDALAEEQKRALAESPLFVSAKTGQGIKGLVLKIKSLLLHGKESARVQAGLGSERQRVLVQSALESVSHALSLEAGYSLDAAVQDLEDALDALGELTGEVTADDVLESIFSHFCVGK